jgi:hypothetical protein
MAVAVAIRYDLGSSETHYVQLQRAATVADLRAALLPLLSESSSSGSSPAVGSRGAVTAASFPHRLVHNGGLLQDDDRRPVAEWYNAADVVRVVPPPSPSTAPGAARTAAGEQPRPVRLTGVAPMCGPAGGGTRVTVTGHGTGPRGGQWCLRFGAVLVRAHVMTSTVEGDDDDDLPSSERGALAAPRVQAPGTSHSTPGNSAMHGKALPARQTRSGEVLPGQLKKQWGSGGGASDEAAAAAAAASRDRRGGDIQPRRWSLCCATPPNPPGTVSVEALCDGALRTLGGGGASFTYLSERQWAAVVGQVAAPSHARGCMVAAADEAIGASNARGWPS